MDLKRTKKELQKFAKEVIRLSKANLRRDKKIASGKLERSLDYNLKTSQNSFQLQFLFNDYGEYVDAGVDGKKKKYGQRKYGLKKYSFKSKMPPPKTLDKWVVKRNLEGVRNKQGQFVNRKSLTFAIAKSIFQKGFKPSYFFSDAFNKAFKNIDKELIEKYALDVETFLDYTLPTK